MLKHFLRFLVVIFGFVLLSAQTFAQDGESQAPVQTFAQWFESQVWDENGVALLNERASAAYKEVTGSPVALEELMGRNTFFWYWPDFENRALSLWPENNLACVNANASSGIQSYYLDEGMSPYLVSTIFHENIHSDVFYEDSHFSESFSMNLSFIEYAYGFDVRVNGEWDHLQYFEEAFADYADAYIMRQIGFEGYYDYGYTYGAGVVILEPVMSALVQSIGFQRIYQMHTESDIENIFFVMGQVLGYTNGTPVDTDSMRGKANLMAAGYDFALGVHNAIIAQMSEQSAEYASETQAETTPEPEPQISPTPQPEIRFRPTCGMWLRFSPQQYMDITSTYTFQSDDFHLEGDGNWYIIEEDYYTVIDRQ